MEELNKLNHLSYVALGDSLTVGIGTVLFEPDFVDWYSQFVENTLCTPLHVTVIAHSGAKLEDVARSLDDSYTQKRVKEAEIITITAGGNDLIDAAFDFFMTGNEKVMYKALFKSQIHCRRLIERIHDLKSNVETPYIIRAVNLYNPFPQYEVADQWVRNFNAHVESCLAGKPHSKVADVYPLFKGHEHEWIKGVHPNELGYKQMAKAVHQLGYQPLIAEKA